MHMRQGLGMLWENRAMRRRRARRSHDHNHFHLAAVEALTPLRSHLQLFTHGISASAKRLLYPSTFRTYFNQPRRLSPASPPNLPTPLKPPPLTEPMPSPERCTEPILGNDPRKRQPGLVALLPAVQRPQNDCGAPAIPAPHVLLSAPIARGLPSDSLDLD